LIWAQVASGEITEAGSIKSDWELLLGAMPDTCVWLDDVIELYMHYVAMVTIIGLI
jgi:hypothetical protein